MLKLENKQIEVSPAEMLAAMLCYFRRVDPVDYVLIAKHIIKTLREKYPGYEVIVRGVLDGIPEEFDLVRKWSWEYTSILEYYSIEGRYSVPALGLITAEYDCRLGEVYSDEVLAALEAYSTKNGREEYYREKEEMLSKMRKYLHTIEVIQKLNILLISENEADYTLLKQYGFKNINWFRSIRRAKEYFSAHLGDLERHHIILGMCDESDKLVAEKFQECMGMNSVFLMIINGYNSIAAIKGDVSQVAHYGSKRAFSIEEQLCVLAELLLMKWSGDFIPPLEYKEIPDYSNLSPLPLSEQGLRILVLDTPEKEQYYKAIAAERNLKITTYSDIYPGSQSTSNNRYANFLNWVVRGNIGGYDIVIMPKSGAGERINASPDEIREQCIKKGRQLVYISRYTHKSDSNEVIFNFECSGIRMNAPVSDEITFKIDDSGAEEVIRAILDTAMNQWKSLAEEHIGVAINGKFGETPNVVSVMSEDTEVGTSVVYMPPTPTADHRIVEISIPEIESKIERFDAAVRNVNVYIGHSSERNIYLDEEGTVSVLFEEGVYSTEVQYSRNGVPVFAVSFPKDEQSGNQRNFSYRRYNSAKRKFTGKISAHYSLDQPSSGPPTDDQKIIDIVIDAINTGLYWINMEWEQAKARALQEKMEQYRRRGPRRPNRDQPYIF